MAKHSNRYVALGLATTLLGANFWAWSLLSPLAPSYASQLHLTPLAVSMLLAGPIIIGSLGRIPLGLLTDKYGGHRMFVAVSLIASIPVIGLAFAHTYSSLLLTTFCLGLSGASFAIGVPFVSAWFSKRQQGFALGVYALGNAGTAVSGLLTPRITAALGRPATFFTTAGALLFAGLVMAIVGHDSPTWKPARTTVTAKLSSALVWKPTWRLSLLYAVTFGAFVAMGLYLPIILTSVYHLPLADAAARAAGFIVLATAARPIGGWLSDRAGETLIIWLVFGALTILVLVIAFEPSLMPLGTIAYLTMATALGIGNGAIFSYIGRHCPPQILGTVGGVVGSAGGLGGFFPPLIMGASLQLFASYFAALMLLAIACFTIFLSTKRLLTI